MLSVQLLPLGNLAAIAETEVHKTQSLAGSRSCFAKTLFGPHGVKRDVPRQQCSAQSSPVLL